MKIFQNNSRIGFELQQIALSQAVPSSSLVSTTKPIRTKTFHGMLERLASKRAVSEGKPIDARVSTNPSIRTQAKRVKRVLVRDTALDRASTVC